MLGIGSQHLGTSPAGLGQADAVTPLPSFAKGARYIGADGNPVIDPVNGGFMKADPIAMRVVFAIKTTLKSSSANQNLGVEWPKKIDARFESTLSASVMKALFELTSMKQISVDGLSVEYPQPERYTVIVDYTNLVTKVHDRVAINGVI